MVPLSVPILSEVLVGATEEIWTCAQTFIVPISEIWILCPWVKTFRYAWLRACVVCPHPSLSLSLFLSFFLSLSLKEPRREQSLLSLRESGRSPAGNPDSQVRMQWSRDHSSVRTGILFLRARGHSVASWLGCFLLLGNMCFVISLVVKFVLSEMGIWKSNWERIQIVVHLLIAMHWNSKTNKGVRFNLVFDVSKVITIYPKQTRHILVHLLGIFVFL